MSFNKEKKLLSSIEKILKKQKSVVKITENSISIDGKVIPIRTGKNQQSTTTDTNISI